jgi:hypothetical protein
LPAADLPCPKQAEPLAVPGNHGIRFYNAEGRAPRGQCSTKPGPQHPVEPSQFRPLHGSLQHAKLMTKRENLKLQCRSSSEKRQRRGKECRQIRQEDRIEGKRSTPTVSATLEFARTTDSNSDNVSDRTAVSRFRAILVRNYLQSHFHLDTAKPGVVALENRPPGGSAHSIWKRRRDRVRKGQAVGLNTRTRGAGLNARPPRFSGLQRRAYDR